MKRAIPWLLLLASCTPSSPAVDAALYDSGPPPGAVGAACTADVDCQLGLTCFVGPTGARPWPGGYCSRSCMRDDCPGSAVCGEAYWEADNDVVYQCVAPCTREDGTRGGCREGYQCMFDGICHVGCTSDAQCETVDYDQGAPLLRPGSTCELATGRCIRGGTTGGDTGDTCTTDADCRGPYAACNGGTCVRVQCDLGGAYACSAGQACIGFGVNEFDLLFVCARTCTLGVDGIAGSPGVCLDYEACVPPEEDGSGHATQPFCLGTPNGGGTGSTTARVGSPCSSNADCPNPLGYGFCAAGFCQVAPCASPSLASFDVCGPGARCSAPSVDPMLATPRLLRDSELGLCYRDCSMDATVCEAPTSCHPDGFCY